MVIFIYEYHIIQIMVTEPIQIDIEVVQRLRQYVAKKNKGKTYGQIGKTAGNAITEYLDLIELRDPREK